jgi:hypothetical protein
VNPNSCPDELYQFFAGHFHEDWPVEASTPDGIIREFLAQNHDPEKLGRLADLIDEYIGSAKSDDALERGLFHELGCYYMPSADGLSERAWLEHVAKRLREGAGQRPG